MSNGLTASREFQQAKNKIASDVEIGSTYKATTVVAVKSTVD